MSRDGDNFEIVTSTDDFENVKSAVEKAGIPVSFAEVTMIPQNYMNVDDKSAEQLLRLIELLEDHDDVQNVYSNFNITDEVLARLEK